MVNVTGKSLVGTGSGTTGATRGATVRSATARAQVVLGAGTMARIRAEPWILKKGDLFTVAKIAGIQAAKWTAHLIPLCHPIAITHVQIDMRWLDHGEDATTTITTTTEPDGEPPLTPASTPTPPSSSSSSTTTTTTPPTITTTTTQPTTTPTPTTTTLEILARCESFGVTGVEMEAMTAASIAALTVYDMCKAVDKGIVVREVKLLEKSGGKSGHWTHAPVPLTTPLTEASES